MMPYIGDFASSKEFKGMVDEAYSSKNFPVKGVVPLRKLDNGMVVMELFHGPTLAFKDVALQLLGIEFEHALNKTGGFINILGATSGDTGSAAIYGCRGRKNMNIFILHPHGRTSPIQAAQMTTVLDPNVFNVAYQGTFDDAQADVKALFNDKEVKETHKLVAINSINFGRIAAQVPYFMKAAAQLGTKNCPIDIVVPTGNFGDIAAGCIAKDMGAPIRMLVCASNANDILDRFFKSGTMMTTSSVAQTPSPSMDIQISSNFERLLFDANGRDAQRTTQCMLDLKNKGQFTASGDEMAFFKQRFMSGMATNAETLYQIKLTHRLQGYLMDPHTAVGMVVANKLIDEGKLDPKRTVVLSTAHPAKFPDDVQKATGIIPALPAHMADIMERPQRHEVMPHDVSKLRAYVEAHALRA
jgi:threonine synthase